MKRLFCLLAFSALVPAARAENPSWRSELPRPIYEAHPELVGFYSNAWELAHRRIDFLPGIPAPRYMDEAHRSDRIWIWDTCFMVHFCKYAPREFPGIESLDNFYGIMLADRATKLPLVRGNVWCGKNEGKMLEFGICHPDNPPLFAWTELRYALQTGDRARLKKVYSDARYLQRWFDLFESFDPAGPQPFGAEAKVVCKREKNGYRWGGCPSGMDNTVRGREGAKAKGSVGRCVNDPNLLWVDALAQQALSALSLARIANLLGDAKGAAEWRARYDERKALANRLYWDKADSFYYDIRPDASAARVKVPTIASYWALLAEFAAPDDARKMLAKLTDPATFGGVVSAPSQARNDADFCADGGYWRGSVWLPTAYAALKAADAYGDYATARAAGRSIVEHMYRTYVEFEPHTIWECYSPTEPKPAKNKRGKFVRHDFCGWSALGPIAVFIEDVIGVKEADAFARKLVCDFEKNPVGRVGVENYRFGDVVCSVIATAKDIVVESNAPFTLVADGKSLSVRKGRNAFSRKAPK